MTAKINLGRVSLVPAGTWDAAREYKRLDVVTHGMGCYVAKADVPAGTATDDGDMWQRIVDTTELEENVNEAVDGVNRAEAERAEAERGRVFAEAARASAEGDRAAAEAARASAEAERATAESARATAESARASAEADRKSAESARDEAEAERAEAEDSRKGAEEGRAASEAGREGAESARRASESARSDAEGKRASAEAERATAESERAEEETSRREAETARSTSEGQRVAAEAERQRSETDRSSAEAAREEAETARAASQEANDAAQAKNNADQRANNAAASGITFVILASGQYDAGTLMPTVTGENGKLYLVPDPKGGDDNLFLEWVWLGGERWEHIGSASSSFDAITTDQVDSVVAGDAPSGTQGLSLTGLSYLWAKMGAAFAAKGHTHAKADITDLADWAKADAKPAYTATEVGVEFAAADEAIGFLGGSR